MDAIDELCSRWWRQQNAGGLNYLRIFAVLNGQIERNRKRNTVHGFMLLFYGRCDLQNHGDKFCNWLYIFENERESREIYDDVFVPRI